MPLPYAVPFFHLRRVVSEYCQRSKGTSAEFYIVFRRVTQAVRRGEIAATGKVESDFEQQSVRFDYKDGSITISPPDRDSEKLAIPLSDDFGMLSKFMCARTFNVEGPAVCFM